MYYAYTYRESAVTEALPVSRVDVQEEDGVRVLPLVNEVPAGDQDQIPPAHVDGGATGAVQPQAVQVRTLIICIYRTCII